MGHGQHRASCDSDSPVCASVKNESTQSSNTSRDEAYSPRERHGWPKLAHKMAVNTEFAAFSRFRDLNTRTLLFYQAQINLIRTKILQAEEEEEESVNIVRYSHLVDETESDYHKLLMELRGLLREYSMYTYWLSLPTIR